MKRLIFFAAAVGLFASPAFSQQGFDQRAAPGTRPLGGSGAAVSTGAPGAAQPGIMSRRSKAKATKAKGKKIKM